VRKYVWSFSFQEACTSVVHGGAQLRRASSQSRRAPTGSDHISTESRVGQCHRGRSLPQSMSGPPETVQITDNKMHNNQKPDGQWVPGQENLKKKSS